MKKKYLHSVRKRVTDTHHNLLERGLCEMKMHTPSIFLKQKLSEQRIMSVGCGMTVAQFDVDDRDWHEKKL